MISHDNDDDYDVYNAECMTRRLLVTFQIFAFIENNYIIILCYICPDHACNKLS